MAAADDLTVLRAFVPDDDDELVGWFPDAAAVCRFAGDTLRWPLTRAQLDALRADPRIHAWTAWATDPVRRVGHAELVRVDDGVARLVRVAVAPRERGRRVGTSLLRAVLEQARSLTVACVELNVYRDNGAAVRLYRSAGFEDQPAVSGRPDVLRMARALP
jgi:ribosomal protein S18 acetylase RimI-like enzyme